MTRLLRQSTSVDVPIGPFLDETDGKSPETTLTITQPDVRLKKNSGAWAQKNAAQTLSHEENGNYEVTLDATDTDTLGLLRLHVNESGALPVWEDFWVVTANFFDSLFSTDFFQVDLTQLLGSAIATPSVAGVIEADQTHYLGAAAPALVGGRYDSSVGAMAASVLTASAVATGAIDDDAVAADMDSYAAKLWMNKEGTTADKYGCVWFKNGQPVLTGVTSPTIQVFKASDGTDLIAVTAMTEVGSHHVFKKEETTNKTAPGDMYWAKVQATIDGSTRTWLQPVPRDST